MATTNDRPRDVDSTAPLRCRAVCPAGLMRAGDACTRSEGHEGAHFAGEGGEGSIWNEEVPVWTARIDRFLAVWAASGLPIGRLVTEAATLAGYSVERDLPGLPDSALVRLVERWADDVNPSRRAAAAPWALRAQESRDANPMSPTAWSEDPSPLPKKPPGKS